MPYDNKSVIESGVKKAQGIADMIIYATLEDVCVEALEISRGFPGHPYDNFTYNLQQSIACAIYHEGGIVFEDWTDRDWSVANPAKYEPWGAYPGDGIHDDGPSDAKDFLDSYVSSQPWEVVFIAGAEYADNIERFYREKGDPIRVLWGAFTFISMNTVKIAKTHKLK